MALTSFMGSSEGVVEKEVWMSEVESMAGVRRTKVSCRPLTVAVVTTRGFKLRSA